MAVKEDPEKMQRLVVQSSQLQGSQPSSLVLGRDSKAGREEGKLYSGKKKGRLQLCSGWKLLAWGSRKQAKHPM